MEWLFLLFGIGVISTMSNAIWQQDSQKEYEKLVQEEKIKMWNEFFAHERLYKNCDEWCNPLPDIEDKK